MKQYPYYTTFCPFYQLIFNKNNGIDINIGIYIVLGFLYVHFEILDGVIERYVANDSAHELYIGSYFSVFHKRA